ncbi:aminotransferase class I/II-fold pyridoxal phosphate-dependent enzyme [Saccharothrix deserti]|uniref:aminotransferase class I/II-fold pyridoxal phosphate-dependent enzyme n=1 Tax=Saccharothrix deserti TaxID=2593674 RepID=UPI001EE4A752|nr:aminotransferase class I/II-fold pyridoxal phosphate-dependent enzyme [Saccharothrix deserti]
MSRAAARPESATPALAPLERFTALHRASQWFPDMIDLSFPNPRVPRDDRAMSRLRAIAAEVDQADLQYTPFGGRTAVRRKVAAALGARAGVPTGFADVFLTPGATAALSVAIDAFFRPGDEVLLVVPGWMDYELYLTRAGVRVVPVPCGAGKVLDIDAVAARCGPATSGVILSQPQCPTGVVHSAQALSELANVLKGASRRSGRRVLLISDEVHRDLVWHPDTALALPMAHYPDTVSIYSYGKAWSLQGQRTGYLALGEGLRSAEDRRRVDRALRATGTCAPTALMQHLVAEVADMVPDQTSLRQDQQRVRAELAQIGYDVIPAQATPFVYVRCPHDADDWSYVETLRRRGVLAMPSTVFHEPNHFRLALNTGPETLPKIIERLRTTYLVNSGGLGKDSADRGERGER